MIKNRLPALLALFLLPSYLFSQAFPNDCANAWLICNKNPIAIQSLDGPGADTLEVNATSCLKFAYPESNSAWFKWTVQDPGTLLFTILPLDEQDDVDFILYRIEGSIDQCELRQEVRCIAIGPELGEVKKEEGACTGATGLQDGAPVTVSGSGCPIGAKNFLAPITVQSGESYLLFINNFRSPNGFLLEFSGSCTFREFASPCNTSQSPYLDNFRTAVLSVSDVIPNPATDAAQIVLQASESLSGQLSIIDLQGRIRKTAPLGIVPGENTLSLDVSLLEPGVYFAKIRFKDQTFLTRFYKH